MLDDFEPIEPASPVRLSDLVNEIAGDAFLDTNALAKRYVSELGTPMVRATFRARRFA